jgi:hypothetical protein
MVNKIIKFFHRPLYRKQVFFLDALGMKKCTEWPDFYYHAAEILAGTCNTTSSWTKGQTERSMNGYLSSQFPAWTSFLYSQAELHIR